MTIPSKIKFKIKEIYILIFFISYMLYYFSSINIVLSFAIWIMIGLMGFWILRYEIAKHLQDVLLLLVVDIVGAIGLLINGCHSVVNIFIVIVEHVMGLYLFCFRGSLNRLCKLIYLVMIYIVVYTFTTPKVLINAYFNEYTTKFSNLVGGNTISVFLLMFLSIDLINRYYQRKKINYIWVALSFLISVYSGGTGGVLTIGIFIIGLACIDWKNNKISMSVVVLFFISSIVGFCVLKLKGILLSDLLDDNSRFWIWNNYLSCAFNSLPELVFGGSVRNIPFLYKLNNMHNSFLNLHFYYGLIPFVFYTLLIVRTFIYNIKEQNYYLVLIMGCCIIRAFTDETTCCFMTIWTYAYLDMKSKYMLHQKNPSENMMGESFDRIVIRMDN